MRKLLFASLLLTAACGASTSDISAVTALSGSASSGATVFSNNCATCHGADGTSGSAHRPLPTLAAQNEDGAVSTILSGEDEMPSFSSTLSNQQIADVIAWLKSE